MQDSELLPNVSLSLLSGVGDVLDELYTKVGTETLLLEANDALDSSCFKTGTFRNTQYLGVTIFLLLQFLWPLL